MTMVPTPAFVQNPDIEVQPFTNSDSANTKKTIATGPTNGMKVVAVLATSTETANDRLANLWLTRSGVSSLLGSYSVLRNSGFDGIVPTPNLLALISGLPHDNDGQAYIFLKSADTLQVSFTTQVASGKEVDVFAIAGGF